MPDPYFLAKLFHILAVSIMVGATAINGMIHVQARAAVPSEATALLRAIVQINRLFMGPSLGLILLTGFWLMLILGYDFQAVWLKISIGLTLALILAFVLGAHVENHLHDIATASTAQKDTILPKKYHHVFQMAAPIGLAALVMSIATLILMIFKPI